MYNKWGIYLKSLENLDHSLCWVAQSIADDETVIPWRGCDGRYLALKMYLLRTVLTCRVDGQDNKSASKH